MAIVSLRATISALSALSVAVVAAITLSSTLTTSLSALRSIGQTHATSLLLNARLQTEALFHRPVIATEALGNVTRSSLWPWPSDDPNVTVMYRTMVLDQFLACEGYCSIIVAFSDSSQFQLSSYNADMYSGYILTPAPYSIGGLTYQLTQPVALERVAGFWANNTSPPPSDPVFNQTVNTGLIAATASWRGQVNSYGRPQGVSYGGVTTPPGSSDSYSVVLYSHMVTSDPTYLYAATAVSLDLTAIQSYLRGVAGTPNTAVFAYDDRGFLFGTNLNTPYQSKFAVNTSYVAPPGCTSNVHFSDLHAGALLGWCRDHITRYGYAPLQQLASNNATAFTTAEPVGMFTVDGSTYYYAVAQVDLKYHGMGVWLALIMPEADIIGDVVSGRNTAIGITCGVFVLAACATFVAIAVLLRPLTAVADRMMLAASLEDDEADDSTGRSAMSEVENLQSAYAAMNLQLNRIKSFVPKTALRITHRDADDADDGVNDLSTSASRQETRSDGERSKSCGASEHPAALAVNHLECGLVSQFVTVVSGDMDGFDAAVQSISREAVVDSMSQTVRFLYDAAAAHKGVVQSFHGDHFVVTFNAVSPCVSHARRGANAALHLTSSAGDIGMQLRTRAGVATGKCLVGNLGSQEAKGFNTIGPAFVQAVSLQRLSRNYGDECRVLATRRTCMDVATHLRFVYVDIVPLPHEPALIGAIASAATVAPTSQVGEWLYVASDGGEPNNVEDLVNEAFISLAYGRLNEVTFMMANQLQGVDVSVMKAGGLRCMLMQRLRELRSA